MVDILAALGLEEIAAGVSIIVGAIVAVWLFAKRVWPVVKTIPAGVVAFARGVITAAQVLDSVKGLPAFIERTDKAMAQVHHELHPNHGTSMNDALRRTEAAVETLAATSQRLEEGVAGLHVKYEELAAVDDRLWSTLEPDCDDDDEEETKR
ncbi:hypothetical protein DEU35_1448 [Microbacterium sp. AG157]|uniref:hypothetical protein n=1 Tax=Microbacterium sp. AG157 TaxID=2183993 RepID=UPI000E2639D6|nr:hypothetical protein [Microbacterium sp. AG157]REC98348.1 hypothetical protein DEU35_1448 [Microbacterium sp. AG157]